MSARGARQSSWRHEDRNQVEQTNPPSRHLWIGNLPHSISEDDLTRLFSRHGDLESVAFQPGRSYAFVNFRSTEEAIAVMKALQSYPVAGNPIRVEFTKDKSSIPARDAEQFEHHDEPRTLLRSSPFSQREYRLRRASPESFHPDKSKSDDKGGEPSEVLWIGFPAQLRVDEVALKKAFSPFGEIEKITAFPGRTYAFVRFRNIVSACRAKETLQGKLFGNPRVHICFARSESGGPSGGRSSLNASLSPRFKSEVHPEYSESFWQDRTYSHSTGNLSTGSPRFISNLDSEDRNLYSMRRRDVSRDGGDSSFNRRRFAEETSDTGLSRDVHGFHGSPMRERGGQFPYSSQKAPAFEPWDLPEEPDIFPGSKRPRTDVFPHDNDLLEYSFSDLRREKQALLQIPDQAIDFSASRGERGGHLRTSYDNIQVASGLLPSASIERRRATPEPSLPSLKDWKWEGIIAKGGTPICRTRCFPVGKALHMMLPEFLDCTARTSLDMLAKHYYQAADAWVVFFVPENDTEMGFYNEFMHYLEEKQRAAVAKLDERTTMFLVPPSEFSEKVLKVPGKLSISGVVLRLENPSSRSAPLHHPDEIRDGSLSTFNSDVTYLKRSTPSGPSFPGSLRPGVSTSSYSINVDRSTPSPPYLRPAHYSDHRHDHRSLQQKLMIPNPTSGSRDMPLQGSYSSVDYISKEHRVPSLLAQETGTRPRPYAGESSEYPSSRNANINVSALQPEQLAQLASSLFPQQGQSVNVPSISMGEDYGQRNARNHSERRPFTNTPENYNVQNSRMATSELSTLDPREFRQFRQQSNVSASTKEMLTGGQGSQQLPSSSAQDGEADPQKRLQATLQLAAVLLQQIQQGKGT